MNRIIRSLAIVLLTLGVAACDKNNEGNETPTPQPTPVDTTPAYAFVYQGQTLSAGDTIQYYPTAEEADPENDMAAVVFYLNNLTGTAQQTCMKVVMEEGPMSMGSYLEVCFGSECTGGPNPWTSNAFNVNPGLNSDLPIKFDYRPSLVDGTALFKFVVGQNTSLARPQTMYIRVAAAPQEK